MDDTKNSDSTARLNSERPIRHDLYLLARYGLGQRRTWLVLTATALGAGAYFNWQWLVAAGIAPLLVALAPCIVMCALGMCMHRGKECKTSSATRNDGASALGKSEDDR